MRKKDKQIVSILNRVRTCSQRKYGINMLKKIYRHALEDPTFSYLFYSKTMSRNTTRKHYWFFKQRHIR